MTDEPSQGPGSALISAANATGVPTTIKGKVQRAIFRLIVGAIGPDSIEKVRANVSTVEGRSRIDAMVAEEIGRQAIADPVFMERAKARFLGELAQKQENVEAVAFKAQAKINEAADADDAAPDPAVEPTQDWMNAFTREAENASSDELRDRLAAVLAGEARTPGTFSRSTVRFIAELERDVLVEFQELLFHRVGNDILTEPSWNTGVQFARGVLLQDAGLISDSGGFLQRRLKFNADGNVFLTGNNYALVANGSGDDLAVSIWPLSRIGREVASLLPDNDEREPLRRIATNLKKANLQELFIGRIKPLESGQIFVQREEVLWKATEPETGVRPATDLST